MLPIYSTDLLGSFIDPLQGHGIDKAIKSGQLAATQIVKCLEENNFNADFIRSYDEAVYDHFGKSFQQNYRLMKIGVQYPWLVNMSFPVISRLLDRLLPVFYGKKKS